MAIVKRPPKFYWSGAYLSKLKEEMGDECIFLCLSPVSFRMLTDMTAMLLWPTRYKEKEVPEVGRIAHQELNVPCLLDLYSRLDELNNTDWLQAQFDALGSRMTELEEMDVNVTQTVNGCGCGCDGDTTSTTQTTSGGLVIDPADTGIVPPYLTDVIAVSDPIKCRSANYLAAKVISTIRTLGQIGDTGGTIAGIAALVAVALTWLSPIPGDEIISTVLLIKWAISLGGLGESVDFTFEYFSDLANAMDGKESEFVCILYDYDTSSELGASLSGWIEGMVEELRIQAGMPDIGASMMSSVLVNIFGANLVNWFVENVETIVPADFIPQYDCLCGATGDSCPTSAIVLAGIGTLPAGDLTGTTQGFASSFNSSTGYYEIVFELPDNYCVTIDNGAYTPDEAHEVCQGGVMVASDGSCIRRFVARSQSPFATAVAFLQQSENCDCTPETLFQWKVGTAIDRTCPTTTHPFASCNAESYCSPLGGYAITFRTIDIDNSIFNASGIWVETSGNTGNRIGIAIDNGGSNFHDGSQTYIIDVGDAQLIDFEDVVTFGNKNGSIPTSYDLRIVFYDDVGGDNTCIIRWGLY